MNLVRSTLNRCDRVDDTETAILMAVPVETYAAALFFDDALHELDHGTRAVRR